MFQKIIGSGLALWWSETPQQKKIPGFFYRKVYYEIFERKTILKKNVCVTPKTFRKVMFFRESLFFFINLKKDHKRTLMR